MPGWHEATAALQKNGKVKMAGIIQEQHPDRARLFMQWKRMDWPILVDSGNLLGVSAVPITLAIDEHGIVRHAGMPVREAERIESDFVDRKFDPPTASPIPPPVKVSRRAPRGGESVASWRERADWVLLWGGTNRIDEAIEAYERAIRIEPSNGPTRFRAGTAFRARYDSPRRLAGDFGRAVQEWNRALEIDPNQYIWRRRIQQYGPRLDKPYPFYDWVETARAEVRARGEIPSPLSVEPRGAEIAKPSKQFEAAAAGLAEPDPGGRIHRDRGEFVQIETIVVPDTSSNSRSARVHLIFRPNLRNQSHWNNEVDGLVLWVAPPAEWQVDRQYVRLRNPPDPVSQETRYIELELRGPAGSDGNLVEIPAYALYYVCEDIQGTCMYRRQDVSISIPGRGK